VFQDDLPKALSEADGVILSQVARMEQLKEEDRLDPERVVADIAATGRPAFYEESVDHIIARLRPLAREGDVVVVLSNGGFGGIHDRLLKEL
jgi:UDP-N-acetylmuramate: L-alanyl-gamma-D-glutamyl-meso-diaminopimelate ligase